MTTCLSCKGALAVLVAGEAPMWRCAACRLEFTRCEYCRGASSRSAMGHRVCLQDDCPVQAIPWVRCEHCKRLTVPLHRPDAPLVCVDFCMITIAHRCAVCQGAVPEALGFCTKPGCSEAFRKGPLLPGAPPVPGMESFVPGAAPVPEQEPEPAPDPPAPPPPPADPMDPLIDLVANPKLFDERYAILGRLFEGGMGEILLVRDHLLGRDIAMKRAHRHASDRPQARAQLLKEARVGARLIHPHILPVHDFGADLDRRPFFTMRAVQGASLRDAIDSLATGCETGLVEFPLTKLVTVLTAIYQAMHFAHRVSVVHRDLKPENVLVSGFSEVFVIDWGLALVDREEDLGQMALLYQAGTRDDAARATETAAFTTPGDGTLARVVAGTPGYMAPEQWAGELAGIGPAADIFGIGGILHYILFGRPPCETGPDGMPGYVALLGTAPGERVPRTGIVQRSGSLSAEARHLFPALEGICRRALSPAPKSRFPDALELELALVGALAGGK